MSGAQDQSAVGAGTSGTAGTPAAQPGETTGQAAGHYVPRPAPGYDDAVSEAEAGQNEAALGLTALAAVLMMLSGGANILEGIAAVIRGSFFVSLPNYTYSVSTDNWGWIHIAAGCVVFLAGVALFTDKLWARAVGVALASLSLLLNLVYIPYFPVWSIVVIAIDAFIIWALLMPRRRYA